MSYFFYIYFKNLTHIYNCRGGGIIKFIYKLGPTVPPGAYSKKFFSKFLNLYNRAKNIQNPIPKNIQNLIHKKSLNSYPQEIPETYPRKNPKSYSQEISKNLSARKNT